MQSSAARLTIYAFLSALEADLRRVIVDHFEHEMDNEALLGKEAFAKAMERLRNDNKFLRNETKLEDVLYYTDYPDTIHTLSRHKSVLPDDLQRYVKEIVPRLEDLIPIRNRVAHVRPLEYQDLPRVLDFVKSMLDDRSGLWGNLKETSNRVQRDPSYVFGLEIPTWKQADTRVQRNLPIPDFDETGFLGRQDIVNRITRKLTKGPYPVISIIGEGGLGKTATALKVAYDLIDTEAIPFEAVVWVSSKSTQLTASDIRVIKDAIQDSLGLLQGVADELIGVKVSNLIESIVDYLSTFKILLILDNLETVLDQRIHDFLGELPSGSKVVITSRIGVGAREDPVRLPPMEDKEAVYLLRAIAKVRDVEQLTRVPNNQLASYTNRMHNSPGYIKWFVSAVQVGRRPEDVLANPEIFLEFCMSNVYDYLSRDARYVISALHSIPGAKSLAEVAYLTEMNPRNLQEAMYELHRTNFVVMRSGAEGVTYNTEYEVEELAKDYLSKHHPPRSSEVGQFEKRHRRLIADTERLNYSRNQNLFDFNTVMIRASGDAVVALDLKQAIEATWRGNFAEATDLIDRALSLSPEYFEVRRVNGSLQAKLGNLAKARDEFEVAVELGTDQPQVHYHQGIFLMDYFNDLEGARSAFLEANRLEAGVAEVELSLARTSLYLRDFKAARRYVDDLMDKQNLTQKRQKMVYDIHLQYFARLAEDLQGQNLYQQALDPLEELLEQYEKCPLDLLDFRMRKTLEKAIPTADLSAKRLTGGAAKQRALSVKDKLKFEINVEAPNRYNSPQEGFVRGRVIKMMQNYGFIKTGRDEQIFFHRKLVNYLHEWEDFKPNSEVVFRVSEDHLGRQRAIDVKIIST